MAIHYTERGDEMRFLIILHKTKVRPNDTTPRNARVINPQYIIGVLLHDAALFIPQSHWSVIHHISRVYLYALTIIPSSASGLIYQML